MEQYWLGQATYDDGDWINIIVVYEKRFTERVQMHMQQQVADVMATILKLTSYLKFDSMLIQNKFHPNPNWNKGALGFFEQCHPNKNKMNSDMGSVADPKMNDKFLNTI